MIIYIFENIVTDEKNVKNLKCRCHIHHVSASQYYMSHLLHVHHFRRFLVHASYTCVVPTTSSCVLLEMVLANISLPQLFYPISFGLPRYLETDRKQRTLKT